MLRSASLTLALLATLAMSPEEALVRHTAGALGVDADYAVCVAWHESRLDPWAVGALGEEGLFQILPSTGEWVAGTWGWERYDGFDPATNALMGVWLLAQGYDEWFTTTPRCTTDRREYPMPKTSRTFQTAQNVLDDDTTTEGQLVQALDRFQQLVWQAAGDGRVTAAELKRITACVRVLRRIAVKSLDSNRLVAALLCAEAGGLKLDNPKTLTRLPALRLLPAREPEEDAAA